MDVNWENADLTCDHTGGLDQERLRLKDRNTAQAVSRRHLAPDEIKGNANHENQTSQDIRRQRSCRLWRLLKLRSTGNIVGDPPSLRSTVRAVEPFSDKQLVVIEWDNYRVQSPPHDDGLGRVISPNLTLVSRIAIGPPPSTLKIETRPGRVAPSRGFDESKGNAQCQPS